MDTCCRTPANRTTRALRPRLHGAYGSKDYFREEIATLVKAGLRVVAWDAPGYGISPLPAGGLTIKGLAEAAAALVERVGSATNVVLGHSMGGIIAPRVCTLLPGRVHGLVISATVGSFSQKSKEDQEAFLRERIEPLRRGRTLREAAMPVINSIFAPGSAGPAVELVRETAANTPADTFVEAIRAITLYEGVPILKQVRQPTLLIAGAHDKVGVPEQMAALVQFIPHARFVCIEGAGHYAFAEQHAVFNEHLLRFVREQVVAH